MLMDYYYHELNILISRGNETQRLLLIAAQVVLGRKVSESNRASVRSEIDKEIGPGLAEKPVIANHSSRRVSFLVFLGGIAIAIFVGWIFSRLIF
jgi:hypothetical protein